MKNPAGRDLFPGNKKGAQPKLSAACLFGKWSGQTLVPEAADIYAAANSAFPHLYFSGPDLISGSPNLAISFPTGPRTLYGTLYSSSCRRKLRTTSSSRKFWWTDRKIFPLIAEISVSNSLAFGT